MKQRLLLCLLMLMVSVGVSWADGTMTLNISKGNTVTVSSDGLVSTGGGGTQSITITATVSQNYDIIVSEATTTLTIKGKVNTCSLNCNNVKSLSFENNGDLTELYFPNAPALKEVKASGNKIIKTENLPSGCVISGNQTLDASSISGNANQVNIVELAEENDLLKVLPASGTTNVTGWQKLGSNGQYADCSAEVHPTSTAYPGNVVFYDANGYYTSGTYKCTVKRGDASVTLEGIKINPANVVITVKESPKNAWNESMGSITAITDANSGSGSLSGTTYSCKQSDEIQITATAGTNYVFDKFVYDTNFLSGDQPAAGSSMAKYTVKAKVSSTITKQEEITVQALFKGKPFTVNYEKNVEHGSISVQKVQADRIPIATVESNSTVEYGDKLLITATPHDDKYYPFYQVNGKEPEAQNQKNTTNDAFKANRSAEIMVDGPLTLTIGFNPNTMNADYSFKLVKTASVNEESWNGIFKSITIGKSELGIKSSTSNAIKLRDVQFAAGETVPMVFTLVDAHKTDYVISVQLNNGEKPLTLLPTNTAGVYTTTFIAPADGDATFTITVTERDGITLYVPKGDGWEGYSKNTGMSEAQEYTYNGQPEGIPFKYSTEPSNLKLDLVYAPVAQASNEGAYTSQAPVNVGEYAVKYSREADNLYAAIPQSAFQLVSGASNRNAVLIIKPAEVIIKTVPSVSVVKKTENGIDVYSYQIGTDGVATALGKTLKGKFEVINNGQVDPTVQDATKSHTIKLRFTAMNGDVADSNYKVVEVNAVAKVDGKDVDKVKVTIQPNSAVQDVKILYGATELKSGAEVPTGATITLAVKANDYAKVTFKERKQNGETKDATTVSGDYLLTPAFPVNDPKDFDIILSEEDKLQALYTLELKDGAKTAEYNGEAQKFNAEDYLILKKDGEEVTNAATYFKRIYFKNSKGEVITTGNPVDADKYTVCLDIPKNLTKKEAAQNLEVKEAFQITQKIPAVTWPTSTTLIGKGLPLSAAQFRGGSADVKGTFSWEKPSETNLVSGHEYVVVFTPDDPNYATVKTTDLKHPGVTINVSNNPVISIDESVQNGHFEVWSEDGKSQYLTGNEIKDKTKVIIRAIPNEDFEVESLQVNECGTIHSVNNGSTFTIDGKSILVTGSFRVIQPEAPDPEIDPNTQYIVTLPGANDVRGAIINNPGKNGVKFNQPFSFSISTLAADAKNLVVKANGVTLTPTSAGTYRLASVTGNTTVTVSLANPTELKVNIPREYKNAKDYLVGKVQVEGPADGKCYYGDQITLVAYPESGVSFTRWSDGNREQLREMTVTKDLTLKAEFSGTPTGIEDIESAGIYAGNGYIQVKNVANADLTVVSISGRIQTRQHLDGDVQVRVPAGVYVVVLESGKDVKRVKVIVR